jgi:hypothetical protein
MAFYFVKPNPRPIFKANLLCLELSNSDNTPNLDASFSAKALVRPTRYSKPKFVKKLAASSFL